MAKGKKKEAPGQEPEAAPVGGGGEDPAEDPWAILPFAKEDNPKGMLEESSFATLFPRYRETYLRGVWPQVRRILGEHQLKAELDVVEGSMTVRSTRKTWDPYIIIKGRDMIKLLARSIPVEQAQRILEDGQHAGIIKIGGIVRNKERFVRRRQRLVGPNGSTLKALELLTGAYIVVQGQTVAALGSPKALKAVKRVAEDCMNNIHPVYHVKELMIRRELEKNPALKDENWERFLPCFKKRCVKRKAAKKPAGKQIRKSVFPPPQTPRLEDRAMETGEYFVKEAERRAKTAKDKQTRSAENSAKTRAKRESQFAPPQAAPQKQTASWGAR